VSGRAADCWMSSRKNLIVAVAPISGANKTVALAAHRTPERYQYPVVAVHSKMLLRPQRKFDHPFEELVCGHAREIVHDELLGVEAYEVTQLQ
jgi:hypothetical protein